MVRAILICAIVLLASFAAAQDVQVNRDNKTIAVTADDSAEAPPEIAVLKVGYTNFAQSKEAAYHENVLASQAIVSALLKAKIPESAIETAELALEPAEPDPSWTPEMKKDRQFRAQQSWTVRIDAGDAQKVLDLAIGAGANDVQQPDWDVSDPAHLQSLAAEAALKKARIVADQMAHGLGARLGSLVYASNRAPATRWIRGLINTQMATVEVQASKTPQPVLKLFPKKVKAEATVYAVFAIE